MPDHDFDLIGQVARCSQGTLGLITHRKELPWGMSWVGIKLEPPFGPWASRSPTLVAWSDVVSLSNVLALADVKAT